MKRSFFKVMLCALLMMTFIVAPISATAASKPKVVSLLRVTAEGARLRKGGSSEYDVIVSMRKGEKVFYLNKNQGAFCLVRTSKGQIGYVYRGYLEAYGVVRLDQVYYAKGNVKVYKKASTSASKAYTLSKHDHVLVYKTSGSWAYIKTLNGKGGYIKLSALQKAT